MSLKCGIVGLPNVGKSTLFNAITKTAEAQSANYPFCTIEPNVGKIDVPDHRLQKLASIAGSEKIIPNRIEIVDIAGLVRGASKGEGLGNKFLSNIRNVDAIIHVVRCFDGDVTHVDDSVDPIRDLETIETELLLADLQSLEKKLENRKKISTEDKESIEKLIAIANQGKMLSFVKDITDNDSSIIKELQLLTAKKTIYVANVSDSGKDNKHLLALNEHLKNSPNKLVPVSVQLESEMVDFSEEEKIDFLKEGGFEYSGLDSIVKECFDLLGLLTFFTVGPKETRSWSVKKNSYAPDAAGVIHTDFSKGFIKAEVISFDDFSKYQGWLGAQNNGKLRIEGKEYIFQEGDVVNFRFNV